ncbi:MAG: GGDEF domain-containing protein [Clostridiaceae bacterium]
MDKTQLETGTRAGQITHAAYDDYKLQLSKKLIRIFAIVAGVLNLALIVPDWLLIGELKKSIIVVIIRVAYTVLMIATVIKTEKLHSFRLFALLVTAAEAIALAIYLFVMMQYDRFDFLIQAFGFIIYILVIFLIPNRTGSSVALALIGSAGFFICAQLHTAEIDAVQYWAALVYVPTAIALCAISAASTERHQFREYIAKSRLEHMSSTDFLTDTANRFRLEEEAGRWMDFCRRQDMPLSLAFVDVDNLKGVNDRYGHAVGDTILVNLAKLFQRQLRSSDTLARWGGDEFVLLLPNTSLASAVTLMERMKASVDEQSFVANIKITWSCGIVEMEPGDSFQTILCKADSLMYEGKHSGKNVICSDCKKS